MPRDRAPPVESAFAGFHAHEAGVRLNPSFGRDLMALQALAYRTDFLLDDYPHRWLPLAALYDPDLPLFPTHYFHVIHPDADPAAPLDSERAYGYVETLRLNYPTGAVATVVCSSPLDAPEAAALRLSVQDEVRHRLGLGDPVVHHDVTSTFSGVNARANAVLSRLWKRVVADAFGDMLPFGRLWDPVLGLARWVASWNSDGGRKGELIQTHYFASRFGERIASSGSVPQVDFYLLPTLAEVTGKQPLFSFPRFASLLRGTSELVTYAPAGLPKPFALRAVGPLQLLSFSQHTQPGRFNTEKLGALLDAALPSSIDRAALRECYNSFNKGPQRTLIFAMMLQDLYGSRLSPASLSAADIAAIYQGLGGSYQSPKAIAIYAQQCFGNRDAVPLDTWVTSFLAHPLALKPAAAQSSLPSIKPTPTNLGKTERLIWVASQARKVHSSVADDVLWCTKYAGAKVPRGANPLACAACHPSIRDACPAYADIAGDICGFNGSSAMAVFDLLTSSGSDGSAAQRFVSSSRTVSPASVDDFTAEDASDRLKQYPQPAHPRNTTLVVSEFVRIYGN